MDTCDIVHGVSRKDSKYLLTSKIDKELEEIRSEMSRLDHEIKKYDRVQVILNKLPQELGWSVPFLPITRHALLPSAMLTSTNEIQVHIGDGWFTRCSAHHAKGICQRRQDKCRETNGKLKEREDMLREWLRVAKCQGGISGGSDDQRDVQENVDEMIGPVDAFSTNEITELISEEEYMEGKAAHKKRVSEYYLKQRALIKSQQKELSDEEIWQRLDELEMEEESQGEMRQFGDVECKERGTDELLNQNLSKNNTNLSSETVKLGWTWDDEPVSDDSLSSRGSDSSTDESKKQKEVKAKPRKLSFADHIKTSSDETCIIEFSHTPTEPTPSTKLPCGDLQSPSDIYTAYHDVFSPANTKLKSILKRRSCDETDSAVQSVLSLLSPNTKAEQDLYDNETPSEAQKAQTVLLDIVEKFASSSCLFETTNVPEKNISKFKSSRMKTKINE